MGEQTKIEWCDHTFNPWRGCEKISPGCAHCYAERQSRRNPAVLGEWGPKGNRVIAAESYWRLPVRWNAEAARQGVRRRVFVGSMMDIFEDRPDLKKPRLRLLNMIYRLTSLDWLLLTKRPQDMYGLIGGESGAGWSEWAHLYPHVWLGTSVENQQAADERLWHLRKCPAAGLFVSAEPLLGPVSNGGYCHDCGAHATIDGRCLCTSKSRIAGWIVGGESGPHARPCNIAWIRSIVEQCKAGGTPCFVKQLGARPVSSSNDDWEWWLDRPDGDEDTPFRLNIHDHKGGDISEWPADLRVRELPEVRP